MGEVTIDEAMQAGFRHHEAGRLPEAESIYRQVLAVMPGHPHALHGLGLIAYRTGHLREAADHLARSLAIFPDHASAWSNFGEIRRALGEWDEAQACYERAVTLDPAMPDPHNNLGLVFQRAWQTEEACRCFERALALRPDYPEAHNNLGLALIQLGRHEEACAHCERALAFRPDYAEAHLNLGVALSGLRRKDEAARAFRRALEIQPDYPLAHYNLRLHLIETGQLDAALVSVRQAAVGLPDDAEAHSGLIHLLHYLPATDPAALRVECARWDQHHDSPALPPPAHARVSGPPRRLRVGYVSPDLRDHAISSFLAPVLAAHDRTQFEIHAYAHVSHPDAVTARLRTLVDHWHDISALSDAQAAALIRADGIDILVDLALHTAFNRLKVFTHRPAPVQVSWLGHAGTTGLRCIDHWLTDAHLDPPGAAGSTRGQPVRLPQVWCCYEPPADASPPTPRPGGPVTFGSRNNFAKCNDAVLRLWARVLAAVPGSRLQMHCPAGEPRDRVQSLFERAGIERARLGFAERTPDRAYLRDYEGIDVALDPFPYNGVTTTCEALYMGVPVVTLPGRLAVSRTGLSLLTAVGCAEWVARDEEDFVRIAAGLAGDLPRLAARRAGLRQAMQDSPLMDAAGFTRHVEDAYQEMWREWCRTNVT